MKFDRDELSLSLSKNHDYIYAIGGYSGELRRCLNEVERYDVERDEWTLVAPLNSARRALATVQLESGIFALGGFDGEKYLSSVEYYNEVLNKWFVVSFMNQPRCLFAALPSEDQRGIFVFGGFSEKPLNVVEFMHLEDSKWILKRNMPNPICMHFALKFDVNN